MSLFTRTFPYGGLVDVHSNSGWHIKISRKRQIFICHTTIQAKVDRLRKPEFLIDVSNSARKQTQYSVRFVVRKSG